MNPGPSVLLLSPKFVGLAELLEEEEEGGGPVVVAELVTVVAACSIEANFSCSNAEKAFLGNVLETAVVVEEAMACSYSLCTLFNTFMAFTCLLSTYSGSEMGC
jgi:hypothetical protein